VKPQRSPYGHACGLACDRGRVAHALSTSLAHSAVGPRSLGARRQRRVEPGHQLGQRLHGQPLLQRRCACVSRAPGGWRRARPYRNGGHDRLVPLHLRAERREDVSQRPPDRNQRPPVAGGQLCVFARRTNPCASPTQPILLRRVKQCSVPQRPSGTQQCPSELSAQQRRERHRHSAHHAPSATRRKASDRRAGGSRTQPASLKRFVAGIAAHYASSPAQARLRGAQNPHIVLRGDVRAQPHELGGRGGVAVVDSEHERGPAILQHATAPAASNDESTPTQAPHTHLHSPPR
jgi:hypothetical protein